MKNIGRCQQVHIQIKETFSVLSVTKYPTDSIVNIPPSLPQICVF